MNDQAIELDKIGIDRVASELHREASARTGLGDFGEPSYETGFGKLLESMEPVGPESWFYIREEFIQALVCRLLTEERWKQYPAYKDVRIRKPLVITGMPRTGTTALHKLLSVDEQFQGLQHWLCESPMPRPPRDKWKDYPEYNEAHEKLEERHKIAPGMKIAHEVVVDELDECLEVLRQEFVSNRYACTFPVPEYDRWFRHADEGPSYRRYADILRLIGLNDNEKWLLKNPGHIANLDKLFDVFPDAQVIITSRDFVKATASMCSIIAASRGRFVDPLDLQNIGPRELEYWSEAWHKAKTDRAERPDQFLDVDHATFHQTPLKVVEAIYDFVGLELTEYTRSRMERWLGENPAGKHGEHIYSLEDYGLTEGAVLRAFGSQAL